MRAKKKLLFRKVFFNKKTGQASVTLPKKKLLKFFNKIPKEMELEIKNVKW
jgi:hypothetical protein